MPKKINLNALRRESVRLVAGRQLHYWLWITFFIGCVFVARIYDRDDRIVAAALLLIVFAAAVIADRFSLNTIMRMTKFSGCFRPRHSEMIADVSDYYDPEKEDINPLNPAPHSRSSLLGIDYICDGYESLSNTYGDKRVAKSWRILKMIVLPHFVICALVLFTVIGNTLVILIQSSPSGEELRAQILAALIFFAATMIKYIFELTCYRSTFRWIDHLRESRGESVMR